ncbi:hypothetical protein [Pseudorhodoferax sp. Leaf267]|uniref:hypothetical protein n=1 Tax=Pseudorhodoferax sp. Leaf267 TaxID=1736316 RepID=UPI0012E209F4|nr:hypothetical protein [Pseudorhodoferax sp. Leaf267]
MAHNPPTFDLQEAQARARNAAAAHAAAVDCGRLYSAHEIAELKRQRDDAEAQLRQLIELLKLK